jgi:hypothetical protein
MESWDREALYAEVWEQPLTRGSTKIRVPGRGYWTKKGFDKPVEQPFDAW